MCNYLCQEKLAITIPRINVWHKIIWKRSSLKQGQTLLIFVENQILNLWKIIYFSKHWVIITNTQQKMYFAYLVRMCWNFG